MDAMYTVVYNSLMTQTQTQTTTDECQHGMEPMWCSICKHAAGYKPGSMEHRNDCTVKAFVNLTGADYAEAVELLRNFGRKNGRGMQSEQLQDALKWFGFRITRSTLRLEDAPATGKTFLVSARRGKLGHAFVIQDGKFVNAGQFTKPGTQYRMWEVN
jgi:hypothetical protein